MKKKFKKILSLVTVVTLLVSMLSFWAIPASAQESGVVSPGGSINMPYYTYYYEVVLTEFTTTGWSDVSLNIPQSGTVIIQSFGPGGGYAPRLRLLDSSGSTVLCQDTPRDFKQKGHGYQTLLSFNNDSYGSYVLRIKAASSYDVRLSITVVEDEFLDGTVSEYEDIPYLENGSITRRFYYDTAAMVALYQPTEDGLHQIDTFGNGFDGIRCFLMDPTTTEIYDILEFSGENYFRVNLDDAVTYYVVVFVPIVQIDDGDDPFIEIDYADITVSIVPCS